eukprot:5860260-Prorocentrum_lima.AAC.1
MEPSCRFQRRKSRRSVSDRSDTPRSGRSMILHHPVHVVQSVSPQVHAMTPSERSESAVTRFGAKMPNCWCQTHLTRF